MPSGPSSASSLGCAASTRGGSSYGPAGGEDLAPAIIASGSIAPDRIAADGSLRNEWDGFITVLGFTSGFTVDYGAVPASSCVRLAPYAANGAGTAGNGILAVQIDGDLADIDGDGQVTVEEAATACVDASIVTAGFSLASAVEAPADGVTMRWVFGPDGNSSVDPVSLEEMLAAPGSPVDPEDPPVTETGRSNETETAACDASYSGEMTRTREIIEYSDGSTTPGAWGDWDSSSCLALVETGRTTETETGACAEPLAGRRTRTRDVITYSNGDIISGEWSEWVEECGAPSAKRFSYYQYTRSSGGCGLNGGTNVNQFQKLISVYYDGSVSSGSLVKTGNICNSTGAVIEYAYRDCPHTRYGQQQARARYRVYDVLILEPWTDLTCRD